MKRWLVTGGCGFIGSHLVDALVGRGDHVRVLDDLSTGKRDRAPEGAELIVGDVADAALVTRAIADRDGCFHLAAVASVERCTADWLGSHRTNLGGSVTVFDCARRAHASTPIPVVYASSAAIYGDARRMPIAEGAPAEPISAYGVDKLGSELHGRVAWSIHGVPNIGLRFFNIYGPRQDASSPYSGVIAIFADRIARGERIDIFGDGAQTRDFVYVGDAVRHLLAAMETARSGAEVLNVCAGRATSVLELATLIGEIAGRRVVIRNCPARAGDIRASIGDPAMAIHRLGVRADMVIADGLRLTLQQADNVAIAQRGYRPRVIG